MRRELASPSAAMSNQIEHPQVAIVESQIAAFSRGDVDAVLEHFTENCLLTVMIDGCLPQHGRDGVREYLESLYRDMPSGTARITSVVAHCDAVVAEVELGGRWDGELFDVPATGAHGRLRACVWSVLEDGRIREQRIYWHQPRRAVATAALRVSGQRQ
jgi:predicted ester cyclase